MTHSTVEGGKSERNNCWRKGSHIGQYSYSKPTAGTDAVIAPDKCELEESGTRNAKHSWDKPKPKTAPGLRCQNQVGQVWAVKKLSANCASHLTSGEPDSGKLHVRICKGLGRVISQVYSPS